MTDKKFSTSDDKIKFCLLCLCMNIDPNSEKRYFKLATMQSDEAFLKTPRKCGLPTSPVEH